MSFKGHLINCRIDDDLPFYSQVLLTSPSFHENYKPPHEGAATTFLFKSTDPLITADDIRNLVSQNEHLSHYFNTGSASLEILEKGNNMYSTKARTGDVPLPKVLTVNSSPSFYSDAESFLTKQLREQPKPLHPAKVQKMCDEYMSRYDLEKELNKKLRQKVVTDEEGFQLVTAGPLPVKASSLKPSKKKRR